MDIQIFELQNIYYENKTIFSFAFTAVVGFAQQDAQFTQYMYNTININPAYAGSRGALVFLRYIVLGWFRWRTSYKCSFYQYPFK
jgi:hypothetical protein